MPAMNPELACTVEALGYQGEGIGRPGGKVTFIPYALPGEEVIIKLTREKPQLAFADLERIIIPSADRRVPKCPVFGVCGGCRLQHLAYAGQLRHKRDMVENSLRKIAKSDIRAMPVIGMELPWAYRNKTSWQVRHLEGRYQAGFFSAGSHRLVPTETCPIAHPLSIKAIKALLSWLNSRGGHFKSTDVEGMEGRAVTRVNPAGEIMLSLEGLGIKPAGYSELAGLLSKALPALVSLCLIDAGNQPAGAGLPDYQVLLGSPSLEMDLDGLRFSLSPSSFFQVNQEIALKMYNYVLGLALGGQGETCIDIYSGIGTISLMAAKRCRQVFGLELSKAAVSDAKSSAKQNGIQNAEFIAGPAEKTLPPLAASGISADTVILDPPRGGAHPLVLQTIIQAAPKRLAYISCHPPSQARDAAILRNAGYSLQASQPFDMFPQTAEIENVIIFRKESV